MAKPTGFVSGFNPLIYYWLNYAVSEFNGSKIVDGNADSHSFIQGILVIKINWMEIRNAHHFLSTLQPP